MRKQDPQAWLTKDSLARLWGWRAEGASLPDIAKRMGVPLKTLEAWREQFPALEDALSLSAQAMDSLVERAFFEEIVVKHNATLISLWLRNRMPGVWRDKPPEPPQEDSEKVPERVLSLEEKGALLMELARVFGSGVS